MSDVMYFGGVEGVPWQKTEPLWGATHSNLVICDASGKVLSSVKGPGTNHWTLGIDECAGRILKMVHAAKEEAGISQDTPLTSLGLTLSGCEQESSNAELASRITERDGACSSAIYVASDTAGSLFTGAPNGGMVLIAGTGSNALLRTSDGRQYGCGGWGHLLGDEGGAYWIASKAVKTIFDHQDWLQTSPHPTERVWEAIKEHFHAQTRADLLPYAYKHFDKSQFAGLTAKLAQLANDGDALSRHLFARAGSALAAHVGSLAPRSLPDKLRVVCVGSVWKSWELLKPGALKELDGRELHKELELVRLRVSSAMGAAWLAAKHVSYELPRDDAAYCEVFFTYRPESNDSSKIRSKTNGDRKPAKIVNGDGNTCGCDDWGTWSY